MIRGQGPSHRQRRPRGSSAALHRKLKPGENWQSNTVQLRAERERDREREEDREKERERVSPALDAIWPLSLIQNVILTDGGEMRKKQGMSREVKTEENQEAFKFQQTFKLLFFRWLRTWGMSFVQPVCGQETRLLHKRWSGSFLQCENSFVIFPKLTVYQEPASRSKPLRLYTLEVKSNFLSRKMFHAITILYCIILYYIDITIQKFFLSFFIYFLFFNTFI